MSGRRVETHLPARFMMINSTEESAVIQKDLCAVARPPCRTRAVFKEEQTARMSSYNYS